MSSFIVRIDDMGELLKKWAKLLSGSDGHPFFTANERVFDELSKWPRIKFFYYCDDQDGNTIRIYDTQHLNAYGGSHYLEKDGRRKDHFERVIIRGKHMWSADEASLEKKDSLRNRFREESAWRRLRVSEGPLRPRAAPPTPITDVVPELRPKIRTDRSGQRSIDIQSRCSRQLRLWYFEHLNQEPPFDVVPPYKGESPTPRRPFAEWLGELSGQTIETIAHRLPDEGEEEEHEDCEAEDGGDEEIA